MLGVRGRAFSHVLLLLARTAEWIVGGLLLFVCGRVVGGEALLSIFFKDLHLLKSMLCAFVCESLGLVLLLELPRFCQQIVALFVCFVGLRVRRILRSLFGRLDLGVILTCLFLSVYLLWIAKILR